jgi:hypothetical protein
MDPFADLEGPSEPDRVCDPIERYRAEACALGAIHERLHRFD